MFFHAITLISGLQYGVLSFLYPVPILWNTTQILEHPCEKFLQIKSPPLLITGSAHNSSHLHNKVSQNTALQHVLLYNRQALRLHNFCHLHVIILAFRACTTYSLCTDWIANSHKEITKKQTAFRAEKFTFHKRRLSRLQLCRHTLSYSIPITHTLFYNTHKNKKHILRKRKIKHVVVSKIYSYYATWENTNITLLAMALSENLCRSLGLMNRRKITL